MKTKEQQDAEAERTMKVYGVAFLATLNDRDPTRTPAECVDRAAAILEAAEQKYPKPVEEPNAT